MLHIKDADQSAMPADENKKQEQSELEPLPWEVGEVSWQNLITTGRILIFHPLRAFISPSATAMNRAFSFFTIVFVISQILDIVHTIFDHELSIYQQYGFDIMMGSLDAYSLSMKLIKGLFSRMPFTIIISILTYVPVAAFVYYVCFLIKKKIDFVVIYKVLLYSDITMLVAFLPMLGGLICPAWHAMMIIIMLKTQSKSSWALAVALGTNTYVCIFLLSTLLLSLL